MSVVLVIVRDHWVLPHAITGKIGRETSISPCWRWITEGPQESKCRFSRQGKRLPHPIEEIPQAAVKESKQNPSARITNKTPLYFRL
jgi:hypothetical protein